MKFKTENSEKNNTPYSDAVELNEFVQFSGMLGLDENGLVEGGIVPETEQIFKNLKANLDYYNLCLLYTSPSPRDSCASRMPSSA